MKTLFLALLFCASNASAFGWARAVRFSGGTTGGGVTFTASGGTEEISGGYKYHRFTNGQVFTATGTKTNVEMIICAGGGYGRWDGNGNGGGGAGGCIIRSTITVTTGDYPATVGAGGTTPSLYDGQNTTFMGFTLTGGGRGGVYAVWGPYNGGSGGGGAYGQDPGGTGIAGQGYNGGASNPGAGYGGGGGAGGVGQTATAGGGPGIEWPSGSGIYYGTGGDGYKGTNGVNCPVANSGGGGSLGCNGAAGTVYLRYAYP